MRISTQTFYQRSIDNTMSQQAELSQQNQYMSATKRVLTGADDPVAIATIQRLNQDISMGSQYIKNGEMAETSNSLTETALQQSENILQRTRELIVSAGNGTFNDQNREAIAIELENLRDELVGVANMTDGSSHYLFSGYQLDTQPFQQNEFGAIDYHGDDGTVDYKVGSGVTIQGNQSGSSVFMDIKEGNGTYVAEGNSNNIGSGVIDAASVIDSKAAGPFVDQDYTISISDSVPAGNSEYAVYGLKETAVTGNANVKISKVDLTDANIGTVNPAATYPAAGSDVSIEFVATATAGEYEIQINGQSSLPAIYDANNTQSQQVTVNGISVEVDGLPAAGDQYQLSKYVAPTLYTEGQSVEFNGIKTELKGSVVAGDSFTLRQSETKDIFSTMQDCIDALRVPGNDAAVKAQREMALDMGLQQVDNAIDNVTETRSAIGARLKTIENQKESTLDFNLASQKTLSNLEDLDMAAAISEFSRQQSMLEITQKTFVQMQGMSLFKLL